MAASAAALEAQLGQLRLGGSNGGTGFEEIEVINLTKQSSKDFIAGKKILCALIMLLLAVRFGDDGLS